MVELFARERAIWTDERSAAARRHIEEARSEIPAQQEKKGTGTDRMIGTVGIVGAGTMGSGIALANALAGYSTLLFDHDVDALDRAMERLERQMQKAGDRARLSGKIRAVSDWKAFSECDLVIEAAYESMEVKQAVIAELSAVCGEETILATNTSTLDIDQIADASDRPNRVIGLHFFSPAHVMPLVEIVRGSNTGTDILAISTKFVSLLGKTPIVVGNCYGFAGNRMIEGYSREANLLLLEGNPPDRIDRALRDFGMAMGPFEIADLVGLDVPYKARVENSQAVDGDKGYYRMADLLVELKRFGQKTGQGYYSYEPGSRTPLIDPGLMELARAEAASLAIKEHQASEAEIVARCIVPVINEGAKILEEGIAARPSDLDLIQVLGYGFPSSKGGPMFLADQLGLSAVSRFIRDMQSRYDAYWDPASLLQELQAKGACFSDLNEGT